MEEIWAVLGVICVTYVVGAFCWSFLKGLYGTYIASMLGLNANLKKMGKWAVVTGATDGIGKAACFELASKGINIVLVSRSAFKLQNVAAEVAEKHGVETKIIDVDFTSNDIYERIEKELENLEIGILINNVGMSYPYPEYFSDVEMGLVDRLVHCNIYSVAKMSKLVLPQMRERRKGVIINVSSLLGLLPSPFFTIYAGTKAFVVAFSTNLQTEEKKHGIIVQCWIPGFVATKMAGIRNATLTAPSPEAYVRGALRTVGIERLSAGYFIHKIQWFVFEKVHLFFPGYFPTAFMYHMNYSVRQRYLKRRKERQAKSE